MDDAELLRRSAAGDETAFEILYRRHRDAAYRFAWVLTKSEADAEEVVQDCFITLNRKAREFDPNRAKLRTWLLGIVRYLSYQRARSVESENELYSAADIPSERVDIESEIIESEVGAAVRRIVLALPKAQREAIMLFEFEEMSLAETAAILGIESNAVKARLHRGRNQLRRCARLMELHKGKVS
jgi:RNA polymerase sigma-70 factor, ECF subfamily